MFESWRRDASGVGFEVRWSDYYRGGFRVMGVWWCCSGFGVGVGGGVMMIGG